MYCTVLYGTVLHCSDLAAEALHDLVAELPAQRDQGEHELDAVPPDHVPPPAQLDLCR